MKYDARATESKNLLNTKSVDKSSGSARDQINTSRRPFAVFDIDGTLIRWQLYHAVVNKLASANLLGSDASELLKKSRMKWKNREHGGAYQDYEKQLVICYEDALHKLKHADFDAMVAEVVNEYKDQVYTYTRDLIVSLKKQNYLLLAISGSHKELVGAIADHYGFDDFIGTTYERINESFSGEKFIASHDKKSELEYLIAKHELKIDGSIAVGDSLSDAPMLAVVENPIAFNPDKRLFDKAKQNGWKIVIERKNVIYNLEHHDKSYILA